MAGIIYVTIKKEDGTKEEREIKAKELTPQGVRAGSEQKTVADVLEDIGIDPETTDVKVTCELDLDDVVYLGDRLRVKILPKQADTAGAGGAAPGAGAQG